MGLTLEDVVERSPRPGARVGCVCKIRGSLYEMCNLYCEGSPYRYRKVPQVTAG